MPDSLPPVSVIVPVYNAGEHLRTCLDSMLAQTLPGIEIIAVDDCSTDGSILVLEELERAGKLRLLRQPRNGGPSAARNAGILAATGEFVGFVDADDFVSPAMFEDLYRAVQEGADIASCGIQLVDGTGAVLSTVPFPLASGRVHSPGEMREELHQAFATKLPWFHVRNLYRRSLLADNGLRFDEGIRKGEDSVFNLQAFLLAQGCIAVASPNYSYRKHPSSATATPLECESENLQRMGNAVLGFYHTNSFDQLAYDDFYSHVLRSDLPTSLARVVGQPDGGDEVSRLLHTPLARAAFETVPLWSLDAPMRVRILLFLGRSGLLAPTLTVLSLIRIASSPSRTASRGSGPIRMLGLLHSRGRHTQVRILRRARMGTGISGRRGRMAVALTYDDGPGQFTSELISLLEEEGAAATFFVLGRNVDSFPDVMASIAGSALLEVGSHTINHPDLTKSDVPTLLSEIQGNADIIQRATGVPVNLFRPPWGRFDTRVTRVAHEAGQSLILYGLDSGDWSHNSSSETLKRVAGEAADGDIILLHDTLRSTIDASRPLVRALKERGFDLLTVSELLGPTLPGESYDGLIGRQVRIRRWLLEQIRIFRLRVQRVLKLAR